MTVKPKTERIKGVYSLFVDQTDLVDGACGLLKKAGIVPVSLSRQYITGPELLQTTFKYRYLCSFHLPVPPGRLNPGLKPTREQIS